MIVIRLTPFPAGGQNYVKIDLRVTDAVSLTISKNIRRIWMQLFALQIYFHFVQTIANQCIFGLG